MSEVSDIQAKIDAVDAKIKQLDSAKTKLSNISIKISPNMEGIEGLHVAGTKYDEQKSKEIAEIEKSNETLSKTYRDRAQNTVGTEITYLEGVKRGLSAELSAAKSREEVSKKKKK